MITFFLFVFSAPISRSTSCVSDERQYIKMATQFARRTTAAKIGRVLCFVGSFYLNFAAYVSARNLSTRNRSLCVILMWICMSYMKCTDERHERTRTWPTTHGQNKKCLEIPKQFLIFVRLHFNEFRRFYYYYTRFIYSFIFFFFLFVCCSRWWLVYVLCVWKTLLPHKWTENNIHLFTSHLIYLIAFNIISL